MPKVKMNKMFEAFSGSIGRLVFRQMPDGSVVVSTAPDFSRRKFSKGQKGHQQRFQEAARYARGAAKTEPIYAELAKGTIKTAYNVALSDWFNPPVINQITKKEDRILIEASDNVLVTKVVITILDEAGSVVEKGEGRRGREAWWEYTPRATGQMITAEAWDLAKNVTKFDYELK